MNKARYAAVAAVTAVTLALTAAECDTSSPQKIAGIVVNRTTDKNRTGGGTAYFLQIRKNDGTKIWVREPFANWARCTDLKHEFYPNCKWSR